jgi:hypothetical protein
MIFADLSGGEGIFLDANPLVYYFGAHALFGPASKSSCHCCISYPTLMRASSGSPFQHPRRAKNVV